MSQQWNNNKLYIVLLNNKNNVYSNEQNIIRNINF